MPPLPHLGRRSVQANIYPASIRASAQLPSTFRSLYRLFLRTASVSVLHHGNATKSLRKLWRPTFEDAAKVMHQLQERDRPAASKTELKKWLETWERRADNTLSLLYSSATARGISHKLIRNLQFIRRSQQTRFDGEPLPKWNPNLPLNSSEYKVQKSPLSEKQRRKEAKQAQVNALADSAYNAFGQVVKMTEARQDIILGRIALKRRRG